MPGATRLSDPLFLLITEAMLVNGRIKSVFAESIAATGLSSMAYAVFIAVSEAIAPPTVPEIGRSLGHARQVIQRAVNELVAAGLLEAVPNPRHKRAALLRTTATGERFKRKSDNEVLATSAALRRYIDRDACRRIADELKVLRGQIEAFLRERDGAACGKKVTVRTAQAMPAAA